LAARIAQAQLALPVGVDPEIMARQDGIAGENLHAPSLHAVSG